MRDGQYTGPVTFRPPYGKKLFTLPRYLAAHDRRTVTWDVAPEKSGSTQTTGQLVDATIDATRPGSSTSANCVTICAPESRHTVTQARTG